MASQGSAAPPRFDPASGRISELVGDRERSSRHSFVMRLRALSLFALLAACLPPPPAVDPEARYASPEAAKPSPGPAARPSIAASAEGSSPLAKAATCPMATGRRTFCEGRKICTRDQNGCEKCRCNTELDKDRARFEQTNPWDMRQR